MLLGDDFLLNTEWARKLYHCHAEKMPIIDYHCHLVPAEIYENKSYENLAQVWRPLQVAPHARERHARVRDPRR